MLSLGSGRLTPKVLNHYLHHDLGMQQPIMMYFCPFTHRRIPRSTPKFNQFFIPFITFRVMLSTDSTDISNQHYQQHNLLSQGGQYCNLFILYLDMLRSCNTTHNQFFNWLPYLVNIFTLGGQYCNLFILYSNAQILQHTSHNQLEALSERRPPWPRQIITPI